MSGPAPPALPPARLTAVTLGVRDFERSVTFYEALGFARKVRATGNEVAFFDAGGVVLALYPWEHLAADANLPVEQMSIAFRGTTLAWNCASPAEVDAVLAHAVDAGGWRLKPPQRTAWGGYSGYFVDPDGHPWEVVHAPGFGLSAEGQLILPD